MAANEPSDDLARTFNFVNSEVVLTGSQQSSGGIANGHVDGLLVPVQCDTPISPNLGDRIEDDRPESLRLGGLDELMSSQQQEVPQEPGSPNQRTQDQRVNRDLLGFVEEDRNEDSGIQWQIQEDNISQSSTLEGNNSEQAASGASR